MSVVAATGLARVLGCSPGRNTGRSCLGKSVTATGGEPAARSGQRVSCASPVVPEHRDGCAAGNRFRRGGEKPLVSLHGSRAGAQARTFLWLRQKWADLFQAQFEVLLYD